MIMLHKQVLWLFEMSVRVPKGTWHGSTTTVSMGFCFSVCCILHLSCLFTIPMRFMLCHHLFTIPTRLLICIKLEFHHLIHPGMNPIVAFVIGLLCDPSYFLEIDIIGDLG